MAKFRPLDSFEATRLTAPLRGTVVESSAPRLAETAYVHGPPAGRGHRCVVCDGFVPPNTGPFPAFYCTPCYATWSGREHEPWLKHLVKAEIRCRVQNHRTRNRGLEPLEIPLNHLGARMSSSSFMGWNCAACGETAPPAWAKNWVCACGCTKRVRTYEREFNFSKRTR